MRNYPDDDYSTKDAAKLNAEPWMLDLLKMNPGYTSWGPHEDYMCDRGEGWRSAMLLEKFGNVPHLNDLNEVVNFYFEVDRESRQCGACEGGGYNPATDRLSKDWYTHSRADGQEGWSKHLGQVEVDALWEAKRLRDFTEKPTPDQVNAWARRANVFGHDAINQYICVKARATSLGVFGMCETCGGDGYVFTEPAAHVKLVLWLLHPRKGASRGVEVARIQRNELPAVFAYLRQAATRNAMRFSSIPDGVE